MAVAGASRSLLELRLGDPLSELTRKERKSLLGLSLVGIAIVKTGLVPSKIENLGIVFSQTEKSTLLGVLGVVVVYFLIAFVVYAVPDLLAWRSAQVQAARDRAEARARAQFGSRAPVEGGRLDQALRGVVDEFFRQTSLLDLASRPVVIVRVIFEFFVPVGIGLYAVVALMRGA